MGMIFSGCPGAARLKEPTIKEKICPVCGNTVEIFSVDASVKCDKCGFTIYNDEQNCIKWCKYAKQCFGEELYNRLVKNGKEKENNAPKDH
jgi:ribosomal protein S27AE